MKVTAALLASLGTNSAAFKARCEQIAALVQTDDRAAVIAISRLYDRQTRDEQSSDRTVHSNGVGFQECDAKFGGKIARLVKAGRFIFPKHMPRVRRTAVKYRVQLTVLAFIKDRAKLGYKGVVIEEMARVEGWKVETVVCRPASAEDVSGLPVTM